MLSHVGVPASLSDKCMRFSTAFSASRTGLVFIRVLSDTFALVDIWLIAMVILPFFSETRYIHPMRLGCVRQYLPALDASDVWSL